MNSIIAYLEHWAAIQPHERYCTFLDLHGNETESYTYQSFDERTRCLAAYLSRDVGLKRGDRALLVYPPGLEIIVAFFACVRIGVIPVPVYPPMQTSFGRGMAKLSFIVNDCGARVALTTHLFQRSTKPALSNLKWISTDDVKGQAAASFTNDPNAILFLQYTSGSTSDPKGVIVSHENVIHNCRAVNDHKATGVSWLPQYHDMGLIGYYLFPVIAGCATYGFSPADFLKRPILWLETLSRVRATCASSPNFGFEYCLREDKVPTEQLADLDLSSVRFLMNASEPARPETYTHFIERFAPYGLRPEAHVVAYGLAENTLAVTHYGRRTVSVNKGLLASCGKPLDGIHVRVVDPKSGSVLENRQTGEVWITGKSTCQGYWNRPELTHEIFRNRITNDPQDQNHYLRTGDLGFIDDGELFVCGRIKDLIIIRGVNYYPQDIERIVESASPKIRAAGIAAFANGDDLIIIVEVKKAKDLPEPEEIIRIVQTQYHIAPHTIVFVPARTIVKTTSGKISRSLTRQQWLDGKLRVIATYISVVPDEEPNAGVRERLQHFLKRYHLTGREDSTFAEIGIDSLGMVLLLDDIEALLKEHSATELLNEIDVRFLQRLTVSELFSLLADLETVTDERLGSFQAVLKKLRQEHENFQRDCMRHDARLKSIDHVAVKPAGEPLTSVLLTGPTGFFGPFLLSSLLKNTPYAYYALTRARNADHGMDRIREGLHNDRLWTPALDEQLKRRVHVVCGDISQPNLGMQSSVWESLTTRVQVVIHNAALVNYVLNYEAMRLHNVEGTRELLRFAATGTAKEFHFISSTIIFGWTVKGELLETDNNDDMLNLDFGYAQSKWVSEQLVFATAEQGLKVRVYRPSFITASAAGAGSRDDIIIRLLAFMINHGIAPEAANQVSFLPGEIAADNIVAIFKQRATASQTFHVTADEYYNITDITRLITSEYGYPFEYYSIPDFVVEMKRRCTRHDPLYPLLDFFTRSHEKIAAMQHKRYNNCEYRKARKASGDSREDPAVRDTVSYVMTYMLREGLITAPPQRLQTQASVYGALTSK